MIENEVIVCAAIKVEGIDLPICGVRHGDCFNTAKLIKPDFYCKSEDQGFMTNFGRYVDRREAFKIAQRENQIKEKHMNNEILISEDLY